MINNDQLIKGFVPAQLWLVTVILTFSHKNIGSEAGFACISNPCIYGICIDDVNSTYVCYCINGYTGIQCQTNWDECWSSPCLNGGSCIDGIASYNCTCVDGYKGINCELDIDECASNPCVNNGSCVDIPNGFTCQCHPGYTGDYCETDLAVCNSSEVRCHNGGKCVDGPGLSYFCECQPGWTGTLCESEINECESSPCQNGAVCVDLHADYSCACLFGYTGHKCETELELCDMNLCANGALCLIEDDSRVCYCVPDYYGDRCEYQYDECRLRGRCFNGGTCIDGVDNFTCSCPPGVSGFHCECTLTEEGGDYDCDLDLSTLTVPYIHETETSKTTDFTLEFEKPFSSTVSTSLEYNFLTQQSSTMNTEQEASTILEDYTTIITTSDEYGTKEHFSTEKSKRTTDLIDEEEFSTSASTTENEIAETERFSTIFTSLRNIPASETAITTESKFSTFDTTTKSTPLIPVTNSTTSSITTITQYCDSSSRITQTEEVEKITDITTLSEEDEWYVTKFFESSTTVSYSKCSNTSCWNGAKCYITKDGPKCSCRFGWVGSQCEEPVTIKVVAFTGKSFLIHKLNNGTSTVVSLKLKTLSSFGIIFYAQVTSNMYMCLYVQDGFLKFQFSCGVQTMLFSETKYRINTGYQIHILATVASNKGTQPDDDGECSAALRINNTVAMSGEQTTTSKQNSLVLPALYIGGFPKYLMQQLDLPVIDGIIGCMHSLQVDGVHKDIYSDAYDGSEISECSSLACISNPCYHSATCIENGQSWTCLCPLGYVGETCNVSVCINNPCQYGGTCIHYPTNGFLCLCPLGKHGLFCEQDLEISQPTFASSIRGYSSFIAYQLPISFVQHTFELRFKFIPETIEQISLMIFIGQKGQHNVNSDHLSLSFIKGYIALTWNLGGGPRRIFTSRPITKKGKKMHSIKIGRTGSRAWLYVDGFKNITGRAPGRHIQLNITPIIYIGGHDSYNFLTLPHDLPLHSGFAGCIYDVEIKTSHITLDLQKTQPVIGRSVAQCGTSECSNYTCQHGGGCIQHGSTFSCLCPDGWFEPICAYRHNLCDSNYHKCNFGATCVPTSLTYECDCPVGQTGKFCEKHETQLSDISFSGHRSYLLLQPWIEFLTKQFHFDLEFKPLNDRALVMYLVDSRSEFYNALVLKGGILEFRIITFGRQKRDVENEVIKVRSGTIINMGKWTKIRAGRFGQKLYLTVNGFTNSKIVPLDNAIRLDNISVYFGGIENMANIPNEVISGLPVSYAGCIRQFFINYKQITINENTIVKGRNIADCDGTPCGADVCSNGGTCWLNTTLKPHCICPTEYEGERCEGQISCATVPCKNNGRCVESNNVLSCHCPLGWMGPYCDKEMPSLTPFLKGDSYIIINKSSIKKRQSQNNKTSVDLIYMKFSTTQDNGLLLWNNQNQNFFGIGIENGNLKIVWSLDDQVNQYSFVSNVTVNNGIWHAVTFKFNNSNVIAVVDDEETYLENHAVKYYFNSNSLFYLGGFPDNKYVLNETNGIFTSNFNGCIKELAWNENAAVTNFRKYKGENVGSCFEHKESSTLIINFHFVYTLLIY